MLNFTIKFKNCPELQCQINDTVLGNKYYTLLRKQCQQDPAPVFRDPQKYTLEHFRDLAKQVHDRLGWDWLKDTYNISTTTLLHKDIEQFLANGFENIPEEFDELLHETHYALHAIESGSKRNSWLQIEWFNDNGFEITADEYPRSLTMNFGDLRLQNPFVGHHPMFLYEQRDKINISQTCKFHNFVKPGINIVIKDHHGFFDQTAYLTWFRTHGSEFLEKHGEDTLLKFTGHPIIGKILNLDDLVIVKNMPILEFQSIQFPTI